MTYINYLSVYNLIKSGEKILFVTPFLYKRSNCGKLYYLLKNSSFTNEIYVHQTIVYDQHSKTRIREKIKTDYMSNLKEQCIFVYYKNIQKCMLKDRILILTDEKCKIVPELKQIYNFNYVFKDYINLNREIILESPQENYFRNLYKNEENNNIIPSDTRYFIFDTETNGIPNKINYRCVRYDNITGWEHCRMLSIAWLVVDYKFNIISSFDCLIKNDDIHNTVGAESVNKISDVLRSTTGILYSEMINYLSEAIKDCNYIVSHGTDFDFNLLISESTNYNINLDIFKNKTVLNTKQNLWKENYKQGLSEIVSLDKKKYPVLNELEPHNALYDCYLCLELLKTRLLN